MSLPSNGRAKEASQSPGEEKADPGCSNADAVSTLGNAGNENTPSAVASPSLQVAIPWPINVLNRPPTPPVSPQSSGGRSFVPCVVRDVIGINAQPGFVGLLNVGNTCFMNSGLQCLLSNSSVVKFFSEDFIVDECDHQTLTGKFALILRKCWSGSYSRLDPLDFRNAVGACHSQFQDYRQHDCQEFLALLLDTLHEHLNTGHPQTKRTPSVTDVCGSGEGGALAGKDRAASMDCLADNESSYLSGPDFESSLSGDETCRPLCPPSVSNVSSTGDDTPKESTALVQLHGASEDSSFSEPSLDSADSGVSDPSFDVLRWMPNPKNTVAEPGGDKQFAVVPRDGVSTGASEGIGSKEDEIKDTGNDTGSKASEDTCLPERKLPGIEDFFNKDKDTKTLNTNVLVKDCLHEKVSADSSKHHKADDNDSRSSSSATQDREVTVCDQSNDLLTGDAEKDTRKDTNLLANCHDKFSDGGSGTSGKKLPFSERERNGECDVNSAKRIKVDEVEKNLLEQSKLKANTEQNPTKDLESKKSREHLNEDASHSSPSMSKGPQLSAQRSTDSAGTSCINSEDNSWTKSATQADREWLRYSRVNKSIIVDTFQGQFKSTMTCLKCHHVSVTFEPFMYLSVPLPKAFDRQIRVMFIPCYGQQPCCYLVVVNKFDRVSNILQKLVRLIGENPCDIILAEVFENHVARILDNNMDVKFVNDSDRQVYAFEMLPAPKCDEFSVEPNSVNDNLNHDSDEDMPPPETLVSSALDDDKTTSARFSSSAEISNSENQEIRSSSSAMDVDASSDVESPPGNLPNDASEITSATADPKVNSKPDLSWHGNVLQSSSRSPDSSPGTGWDDGADGAQPAPFGAGFGFRASKHGGDDDAESGGTADTFFSCDDVVINHWRTCAICLEEMMDTELLIHPPCEGVLCNECLELSYRHYFRDYSCICPICGEDIITPESFVRLNIMTDCKPRTRILSIPLMYRNDDDTDESSGEFGPLFGHPHILYVPSTLTGELLYEMVKQVVFFGVDYSLILTDGQGYSCSRCLYTQHCTGCEVKRDQRLTLRQSDHLVVKFINLGVRHIMAAHQFVVHESMNNLQALNTLTLYECFHAFMESEMLDENNPWFCPVCCKNQPAKKTMTVWRYPRTLVVYLKRFIYHALTSTKINCNVEFPVDNLDLTGFVSGPRQHENLQYELQSCVCHFGDAHSGHYTAYAKHPITLEWQYFNDESAVKSDPQGPTDSSSVYILFYERKGSRVQLNLPTRCGDVVTNPALTIQAAPQRVTGKVADKPVEEAEKTGTGRESPSDTKDANSAPQISTREHDFYS